MTRPLLVRVADSCMGALPFGACLESQGNRNRGDLEKRRSQKEGKRLWPPIGLEEIRPVEVGHDDIQAPDGDYF
jgi:hypothetical protein